MPFLVLKVIVWKPKRQYSTILQYKKHFWILMCSCCVICRLAYELEKTHKSSHICCRFFWKLSKKWFSKPIINVYKTSKKIQSKTFAPKSRQTYPLVYLSLSTSRNLIILECQMFGEGQKSVWINIPYIRGEELETFLNQTVTYFYHAEEILSAKMSKKNYLKTILM